MPLYLVYVMALLRYFAVAAVVWCVAIVLAVPRRTRMLAKRIAAGMAGSFPGVFLLQILAAPFAGVFLLIFAAVFALFRPAGGWQTLCFAGLFLATVGSIPVASFLGFYTGWRVA